MHRKYSSYGSLYTFVDLSVKFVNELLCLLNKNIIETLFQNTDISTRSKIFEQWFIGIKTLL